jgi:hypothetical protein
VSLSIEALIKLLKLYIMLKKILKLKGAQVLTETEQKVIKGGLPYCEFGYPIRVFQNGRWIWICSGDEI